MKDEGLIYTNENCIGCNKCVGVCLAMGACISQVYKGKTHIGVDPLRCTACGAGIAAARLHGQPLTVRYRRDGERFHPAGRRHAQTLKKLLIFSKTIKLKNCR